MGLVLTPSDKVPEGGGPTELPIFYPVSSTTTSGMGLSTSMAATPTAVYSVIGSTYIPGATAKTASGTSAAHSWSTLASVTVAIGLALWVV